jgi:hypothetical protein
VSQTSIVSASSGTTTKNSPADEAAIRRVMADYNAALNGGKTAAVLPLYADDGIFMPAYSQSAVGKDAVRVAYDKVFDELTFNVKFSIAELVQMAPIWCLCADELCRHDTSRFDRQDHRRSQSGALHLQEER